MIGTPREYTGPEHGDDFQGPPAIDPRAELERVGELADLALEAIADEREGDFRRDILELHTRAATLLHLVATW